MLIAWARSVWHRTKRFIALHQTTTLELMLAVQAVLWGAALIAFLPVTMRRLFLNMPSSVVGTAFLTLGLIWWGLVFRGLKTRDIIPVRRAAGCAFILWLYQAVDLVQVAGFSIFAKVLLVLYLTPALAAAYCWLRCDIVIRGESQRQAA